MKKIFLLSFLIFVSAITFSQAKYELAGIWKATVKAKNTVTLSAYLLLDSNGMYYPDVDSTGNIKSENYIRGNWELTAENEIKLIPGDTTGNVSYYVKISENKYKYMFYDKNGVKLKDNMLEMSYYLEKNK